MQRLILMRHGKAERAGLGDDDAERHLTQRGLADSRLMGKVLAGEGLAPDLALVSASARTQETWAAAAEFFPRAKVQVRQGLYLASAGHMHQAAEQSGVADQTLMIVGHNPGLHELALRLLREGGAPPSVVAKVGDGFPTATAIAFTVDAAGRHHYDGVFYAKDHGGGGGE
jgi:phosphohistidine phosphatase